MKRQHLAELARLIGDLKDDLTPVRYQQLLSDVSDLAQRVNPAFDDRRFREEAAQRLVKPKGGKLNE